MNEQALAVLKAEIDRMDHVQLAKLWRYAPSGHPVFDRTLPLYEHFRARFEAMGGMTPEISKWIGWPRS